MTTSQRLRLSPPRPPASQKRWRGALPAHAPLTSWGILGGVPPRPTRLLVDSETTPHMEERLPRITIIFLRLTCSSLPVLCLELLLVCLFNMRSVACALPLEPGFVTHGVARRVDDVIELARWDHFV